MDFTRAILFVLCCFFIASNPAVQADDSPQTLTQRFVTKLEDDATLLIPPALDERSGYFLVHAAGHIQARSSSDGASILSEPIAQRYAPRWISAWKDGFVLSNSYTIARYESRSARAVWSNGQRPNAEDHEFTNPIRQCIALDDRLIFVRRDGELDCLDAMTGSRHWQRKLESKSFGPIRAVGGTMAIATRSTERERIRIIATDTGRSILSFELPPGESALDYYPGDSTTVVLLGTGLLGIDTRNGRQTWRIDEQTRMQVGQVTADKDGIYVSIDGRQVVKLARDTGQRAWRFEGGVIGEKARVELSLRGNRLLMQGDSFAEVLDGGSGRSLSRITALPNERIHSAVINDDALFAIIKPDATQALWRVHRDRLQNNAPSKPSDAHYYLSAFPEFKQLIVVGNSLIVHDGRQAYGFQLRSKS